MWQAWAGTETRTGTGTWTGTGTVAGALVEAGTGAGGQQEHVPPRCSFSALHRRRLHHHLIQHQAGVKPLLGLRRAGGAMRLWWRAWSRVGRERRVFWGGARGGWGGWGTSWRSQLLLKPVGVLADVLVHVADGNVERASGLASEVVPPGDVERLRLAIGQTGLTGVEPAEELRQLVHQLKPKHRK